MDATKALKKFEELKTRILADGKVDVEEAYVLLNFIEDYVDFGKKAFVDFKNTIVKCREDKHITDEESKLLAAKIEEMSEILKLESLAERQFVTGVIVIVVIGLFALL